MEQSWRWYGPDDPVTLAHIKQAGATGVVTALHHIPIGEVWPLEEIRLRKAVVEEAGLQWVVVESIPVHEAIKTGKSEQLRLRYVQNYKASMRNVSACGVHVFCYNFMPVVDWTRTDLDFEWIDGSKALRFDLVAFAAFDIHILRRDGAAKDYAESVVKRAAEMHEHMDHSAMERLKNTIIKGLPGRTSEAYDLETFRAALSAYDDVSERMVRENLKMFIREIAAEAEKLNAFIAIHPDDPPISLLGLPRIVCTKDDVQELLDCFPSVHNGLTMCVGSYASRWDNDVVDMVRSFADRINFVHLRNVVKMEEDADATFVESDHLDGDVDMFVVIKNLLEEIQRRKDSGESRSARLMMPMRPDHGHQMLDDLVSSKRTNPGYTAIGRLRGLAELRGLEMGIMRSRLGH